MKRFLGVSAGLLASVLLTNALAAQVPEAGEPARPTAPAAEGEINEPVVNLGAVVVTARRVEEVAQEVPISLAVIDGGRIERAGAFNTHRLQQIVPSIQFFTTNPRNSFLNIRGQGLPFGLTNDGIEPGVGLYVDGVFYARPAAATLDFIDVERIEVLRGPQGTLYGKNTTAGALNVTTRAPSLTESSAIFELSAGNIGYVQAKGSVSTPITQNLAGRFSFVSTEREGVIQNVRTNELVNSINNIGAKALVRYLPTNRFVITASADVTRQRPNGYAQVPAGIADLPHQQANRTFPAIAADLGYSLPSLNVYDRVIDHNSRWGAGNVLGGASVAADYSLGGGQLTSITAWRFWDWDPSNDRDWTGTDQIALSQAPSHHDQWSQELRYAAQVSPSLDFVIGAFGFRQALDAKTIEVQGKDAWRWNLNPSNALVASTSPERLSALLDGFGTTSIADISSTSAALFGQANWRVGDLRIIPGLRFNYDSKEGGLNRVAYGGADDPELSSLRSASPYSFDTNISDTNLSGQLTLGYSLGGNVNTYATYATSFKTFGFNLSVLPAIPAGQPNAGAPDLSTARIDPEQVRHFEVGVKTSPIPGITANFNVFSTDIHDFQTSARDPNPSQPRAVIAGVELVRVRGAEFDGTALVGDNLAIHGAVAYNDGKHVDFPNATPPIELAGVANLGAPERVDISGSVLPGLPKWGASLAGELNLPVGLGGSEFLGGLDVNYRGEYSSSTAPSKYLVVGARTLVNAQAGIRLPSGLAVSVWARNVFNTDYLEQLGAAGSSGLYWGVPGDPRTIGVTARWQP